jgi:predicted ATPase
VVEEGNRKVRIAALRPTLADGQAGRRYLATIPGRGCRFVAPVGLTEEPTLREPLRAAGGHVERRAPEESFPAWLRPSTDEALSFPSVQMFVERAAVTGEGVLGDAGAPLAADIYRKLDSIALAIELATARVDALISATLDWSSI